MEHIKATKEGFTHWSSGPGNPTFDPECGACWEVEVERLRGTYEAKSIARLELKIEKADTTIAVLERHKESLASQIDTVDSHIPQWKGTGKGRIQVIEEMSTTIATLREERQQAIDKWQQDRKGLMTATPGYVYKNRVDDPEWEKAKVLLLEALALTEVPQSG